MVKQHDEVIKWCQERRQSLPESIQQLIKYAKFDLNFGPMSPDQFDCEEDFDLYKEFTHAVSVISDTLRKEDIVTEIWYDRNTGEVFEQEPEHYEEYEDVDEDGETILVVQEQDLSEVYHYEIRDIKRIMFGELAAYLVI